MLRSLMLAGAVAIGCSSVAVVAEARPKSKVEWTKIEVPKSDEAARVTSKLRTYLNNAVKHTDFGDARHVRASIRVTELTWSRQGDVIRLACVMVARLEDGPSARSRISFGGDPNRRGDLEKQVLTAVSNGLVSRIAQIARSRAERAKPKPAPEG